MDTKLRSRISNEAKKQYIKEGKKSVMLKKINQRAKQSKLSKLEEYPQTGSEHDSSAEDEPYVLHFSDDDTKIQRKRKPRASDVSSQRDMLKLQREIEELKLQQVKQIKKTAKKKPVIGTGEQPVEKPINHKANALKQKILVEF